MIACDTQTLTDVVNQCFDYAGDGRLTPDQRAEFQELGKRLRQLLVGLLAARFEEGTQGVLDANAQLKTVNRELAESQRVLASVAQTVANIAALAGILDGLVGSVTSAARGAV